MKIAGRKRLFRPADVFDRPPSKLAEGRCFALRGIPVHDGFKTGGLNLIEVLPLAVVAVVPREIALSGPCKSPWRDLRGSSLLRDLPTKRILIRLTGLQTSTGSYPELISQYRFPDPHQQYMTVRRYHHRSYNPSLDHGYSHAASSSLRYTSRITLPAFCPDSRERGPATPIHREAAVSFQSSAVSSNQEPIS